MVHDGSEPLPSDDLVGLRHFRDDDVADIVAACNDAEIARWTAVIPSPYTEADARWWLAQHDSWRRERRAHVFAIVGRGETRVSGSIAVESLDAPPPQVGYWVAPWARRRGYASHALTIVSRWAFDQLGVDHLELVTKIGNERSERVARNAGFRRVGLEVAHRPRGHRDDRTYDVTRWALDRSEQP